MRLYCLILLCVLCSPNIHATTLAQYAKAQTYDIDPDISCINKQAKKVICNAENIEWVEGIIAKKIQYIIEMQGDTLLTQRYFEIQPQNLNFEGYNLTNIIPTSILCIDKSTLQGDEIHKNIPIHIECKMQSDVYKIAFNVSFIATHPMYNTADTILKARMIEHERLNQPLKQQSDEIWQKDYEITIKQAKLQIKSNTLNKVLFDLYKREQRIATNPKPQNDINYNAMQDSIATNDYLKFLNQLHEMLNTFNKQADISPQNKKILIKALTKFIAIATKPNQSLSITIKSNDNLTISLYEFEELVGINTAFFDVIIKILKYSQIKIV